MKLLTISVVVVAVCLALCGCDEVATTAKTAAARQPPTSTSVNPQVPRSDKYIRFWRDFSGSINEEELKQVIPRLLDEIETRCTVFDGIEVVRFANGSRSMYSEPVAEFYWGAPPVIKEFVPDLENAPNQVRINQRKQNEYIAQQRAQHDSEQERINLAYKQRVETEIEKLYQYLVEKPTALAPCTKFASLAKRIEKEDLSFNILLSDGWADCHNTKLATKRETKLRGKLIVLLLTRKRDTQATEDAFLEHENYMHQIFPTAEVVPAYLATRVLSEAIVKTR